MKNIYKALGIGALGFILTNCGNYREYNENTRIYYEHDGLKRTRYYERNGELDRVTIHNPLAPWANVIDKTSIEFYQWEIKFKTKKSK